MLNIKYARQYKKLNKNNETFTMFVYTIVGGSSDNIKAYEESQGEYLKHDEKNRPLYFSPNRFAGINATLQVSSKGKWFIDMSKFEQAQSMCEQFDGKFGEVLAQQVVSQLLGSEVPQAPTAPVEPKTIEASDDSDLENL